MEPFIEELQIGTRPIKIHITSNTNTVSSHLAYILSQGSYYCTYYIKYGQNGITPNTGATSSH